ncbi:hypothetical protein DL771_003589 [Monosporascus sp. 5C6A]|nr:hypothetical protein DL771_003589 [Monosporascus sp. 5C6A]
METHLMESALGDCAGATVVDLWRKGATGLRARRAIDAGATSVNSVDLSPEMVWMGRDIETSPRRHDVTRRFTAAIPKPLGHLPLQE